MIGLHFLKCLEDILFNRVKVEDVKYICVSCYNPYRKRDEDNSNLLATLRITSPFSDFLREDSYTDFLHENPNREKLKTIISRLEEEGKLVYIPNHPAPSFNEKGFKMYKKFFPYAVHFADVPPQGVWSETANVSWLAEPLAKHKKLIKRKNLFKKIVSLIRFFSFKKYYYVQNEILENQVLQNVFRYVR